MVAVIPKIDEGDKETPVMDWDEITKWDKERAENPEWDKVTRVHDWRNHVPERIQKIWFEFKPEHRMALFKWADDLASQEEWE